MANLPLEKDTSPFYLDELNDWRTRLGYKDDVLTSDDDLGVDDNSLRARQPSKRAVYERAMKILHESRLPFNQDICLLRREQDGIILRPVVRKLRSVGRELLVNEERTQKEKADRKKEEEERERERIATEKSKRQQIETHLSRKQIDKLEHQILQVSRQLAAAKEKAKSQEEKAEGTTALMNSAKAVVYTETEPEKQDDYGHSLASSRTPRNGKGTVDGSKLSSTEKGRSSTEKAKPKQVVKSRVTVIDLSDDSDSANLNSASLQAEHALANAKANLELAQAKAEDVRRKVG
ncbi:hypothetical protein GLAREA_10538 [Glarea lozoyensis ATCC 20868]|uniref:Uncharacterized protein n=1 Tax=Glarea lozoyensis (strain ATCC 20868 / MF5171) TaxID=1116229 RepID=S3E993_GLAL2|nr:uncharacterized protein GLAREA_10538 [Glarea lozoyensis ATCC 20868]EPE34843.1 hypothetical protein GLAREA_10538 [Glarea lozoyensis ATCC 20868]